MVCLLSFLLSTALAAPERCDGLDDDGDGLVDNGPVWAAVDGDGDGFGDPTTAMLLADCSELGPDEVSDATDLDDTDPARYPGATESCNGLDDDGDGAIDEDGCGCESHLVGSDIYLVCLTPLPWHDALQACDDRGYHLATVHSNAFRIGFDAAVLDHGVDLWIGLTDEAVEGDFTWVSGGSLSWTNWRANEPNDSGYNEDCVEAEANTGLWDDQNCAYDEAFACEADCTEERFYVDGDGDGLGDASRPVDTCEPASNHVLNSADCDDDDASLPHVGFLDADGDGFGDGPPFVACDVDLAQMDGDCDDEDPTISPAMPDLADDGIDADCDGVDPTYSDPTDTGTPTVDTGTPTVDTGTPTVDTGGSTEPTDTEATGTETPDDSVPLPDRDDPDASGDPAYGFGLGCVSAPAASVGWLVLACLPLVRRRQG